MARTWVITLSGFNTWFTKTGGREPGELTVEPDMPKTLAAYLAGRLDAATEIHVGKLGSEGHVCGWAPRYVSGEIEIAEKRTLLGTTYLIYANVGNGVWYGVVSALISDAHTVVWVNAECDGLWALALTADVLRFIANDYNPCISGYRVIGATGAYCKYADP